jgi:tRNA-specific 2-thiouridylase
VLGRHHGLARYTIGQRRGLGVAAAAPLYVRAKDRAANALVVGPAEDLDHRTVTATDWSWIAGTAPELPRRVLAQVRYRGAALPGELRRLDGERLALAFDTPQRAPAPGQGLVVYDGDECLGGGRIVRGDR